MHTNAEFSLKNHANESPLRHKFMCKIPNFEGLGAVIPDDCTNKCEIWYRGVEVQFHIYMVQCVTPAGRKAHFGPLSI